MTIWHRVTDAKEALTEFARKAGKRFLPDLMPPPERGDHKEASALLERGRKHYNKKTYEKAEDLFRRAILADESYVRAHYFLGLVLYKRDDADGAIKAWKRAAHINPSDPYAAKAEGKLRYVNKHMSRAISELEGRIQKR